MTETQLAELIVLIHAATHSDDHAAEDCDNFICRMAGVVLNKSFPLTPAKGWT
jgi:hypothetical protein